MILRHIIGGADHRRAFAAGGKHHAKHNRDQQDGDEVPEIWHKVPLGRLGYFKMFRMISAIAVFALLFAVRPAQAADLKGHFAVVTEAHSLPDFVFEDASGKSMTLADFRGHPVLLNLWATWCGPCVRELPSLDQLQVLMANDGLVVLAIDTERNGADVGKIYFAQHDVKNLTVYSDPSGHMGSTLHARGLPTSFLINAEGIVSGRVEGGVNWSSPEAVAFLRERLSQPIP